ncbi:MAG: hypothetical protein HYV96_18555 [Opitutae bacterium]|nr:hypothetical protein [Opitutae bacterium]
MKLRPWKSNVVLITVETVSDETWHTHQLARECAHVADALKLMLGDRFHLEVDPAQLSPKWTQPVRPALLTLGVLLTLGFLAGSIWAAVAGGDVSGLALPLGELGVFVGFAVFSHVVETRLLRRRRRKVLAGVPPFRSAALGWALKIVGVLIFLVGVFVPWPLLRLGLFGADAAISETGDEMNGVMILATFVPAIGAFMVYWGYRLALLPGGLVLGDDRRAPVLYLRSFHDDGRNDLNPRGVTAYLLGLRNLLHDYVPAIGALGNLHPLRVVRLFIGRSSDTAEEQLAGYFNRRIGPFVAIGKPGEHVATAGAARLYVGQGEWQAKVLELLEKSSAVVLQPAETEGVWWEIARCLEHLPPRKLLICLASYLQSRQGYEEFRLRFEDITGHSLPRDRDDALFIRFDDNWTPVMLPARRAAEWRWPLFGLGIDLESTLAAFIDRTGTLAQPARAWRAPRFPRLRATAAVALWGVMLWALEYQLSVFMILRSVSVQIATSSQQVISGAHASSSWHVSKHWQTRLIGGDQDYVLISPRDLFGVSLATQAESVDLKASIAAKNAAFEKQGNHPRVLSQSDVVRHNRRWSQAEFSLVITDPNGAPTDFRWFHLITTGLDGTFAINFWTSESIFRKCAGQRDALLDAVTRIETPPLTGERLAASLVTTAAAAHDPGSVVWTANDAIAYELALSPAWLPIIPIGDRAWIFQADRGTGLFVFAEPAETSETDLLAKIAQQCVVPETATSIALPRPPGGLAWGHRRWSYAEGDQSWQVDAFLHHSARGHFALVSRLRGPVADDDPRARLLARAAADFKPIGRPPAPPTARPDTRGQDGLTTYDGGQRRWFARLSDDWAPMPMKNSPVDRAFLRRDGTQAFGVIFENPQSGTTTAQIAELVLSRYRAIGTETKLHRREAARQSGLDWEEFVLSAKLGDQKYRYLYRVTSSPAGLIQLFTWVADDGTDTHDPQLKEALETIVISPVAPES